MDTMSLALEIAKQNDLKWNSVKIIGAKVLFLLPFDILDDKELLSLFLQQWKLSLFSFLTFWTKIKETKLQSLALPMKI